MKELKTNGIGYISGEWPLEPAKPTLVFIHGAGGSRLFWKAQVAGIAGRANTVAVDLPGHGRSDGPGQDSVAGYAQVVAAFIEAIEAPHPVPCGISLGGAIVQQLLVDCPQRFAAGILINTGARLRVAPVIFETVEKNFDAFNKMLSKLASSEKTAPALVQQFTAELSAGKPQISTGDFRACDHFDMTEKVSLIKAPILILTAADDKLTPAKYGEFLAQRIKNSMRVHIAGAGHIAPLEKPDEVNRAILDFLDEAGL